MIGAAWLAVRSVLLGNASLSIIGMVLAVVAAGGVGITALRHSAATKAVASYEHQLAIARMREYARAQARQRRSEAQAQRQAETYTAELDLYARQIADLEEKLRERPRTVCYPKDIARKLNQ